MTRDELLKTAEEAKFDDNGDLEEMLLRFAELVAAHERKECAKVCEDFGGFKDGYSCAAAIRARK